MDEQQRRPERPHGVVAELLDALRDFVIETDAYIDERGGAAGLHRTDLDALGHVLRASQAGEQMTPGALAHALRLSPPATSALLARLEDVGHVTRSHSTHDRRRVEVAVSDQALGVAEGVFAPLGAAVGRVMAGYDEDELRLVLRFLHETIAATRGARAAADAPAGPSATTGTGARRVARVKPGTAH